MERRREATAAVMKTPRRPIVKEVPGMMSGIDEDGEALELAFDTDYVKKMIKFHKNIKLKILKINL